MRELKFRVWDKENKCFFKPIYEAYKGRLEDLSISLSGDLTMHTYDTPLIHESCFPNRFVIQQYTGLKDKNGKEIYEGDILKVPDLYETPENTYTTYHNETVIFANYGFGTEHGLFDEDGDYISEECEVIGNIYENPELVQS